MTKPVYLNTEKEEIHKEGTIATQGQKFIWTKGRWMPYGHSWFRPEDTVKKVNQRKNETETKKVEKAKETVQAGLDKFQKVEIKEEGF